jgi:hypothetical protein
MPDNTIQKAHEIGQPIWFDCISRDLLAAGVEAFTDPFEGLMGVIDSKLCELSGAPASD